MKKIKNRALLIAVCGSAIGVTQAQFHRVDTPTFNFSLPGVSGSVGDPQHRTFSSTGFVGSSTVFNQDNIGVWRDAKLVDTNGGGATYGWTDVFPEFSVGGGVLVAPTREDDRGHYSTEAGSVTGTLEQVFSENTLSRILSSSRFSDDWTLDLYFENGKFQQIGNDPSANVIDFAVFERSGNNTIGFRAIVGRDINGNAITVGETILSMSQGVNAGSMGYSLNTTEIGSGQPMYGTGVNMAAIVDGNNNHIYQGLQIIGLEFFNKGGKHWGGPDIQVLANPVPEPFTMASLALGLGALLSRRRKK